MFRMEILLLLILVLSITSTNGRMSFHRPIRIGRGKHSSEKPIVSNKHDKCECFTRNSYNEDGDRGREISNQNGRHLKEVTSYDCVCVDMGSKSISNVDVVIGSIFYGLILAVIVFVNCF